MYRLNKLNKTLIKINKLLKININTSNKCYNVTN